MWSRLFPAIAAALTIAAAPGLANAAWLKGETDKFVVYTDGGERDLRDFIEQLTVFDHVLRTMHPVVKDKPEAAKFEVYLLRGSGQLKRLRPGSQNQVLGFYKATPGGVYAAAIRDDRWLMSAEQVLFHEYTHRFMLENFPVAYAAWLIEAYAEYFSAVTIGEKAADVGRGNQARVYSLLTDQWLPMDTLLGKRGSELKTSERAMFYAQGWLLLHYMISDSERMTQLLDYMRRASNGEDPVKAFYAVAQTDGPTLTRTLRKYLQGKTSVVQLPKPADPLKGLKVTTLPASADDLLLEGQRLNDGVEEAEAPELLARVRRSAARHQNDQFAQLILARAEVTIGDFKAGQAILDRLLAQNPESLEVIREAAHAQMSRGVRFPEERQAAFRAARPLLGKAYQKDPNDFRTLYGYAQARSIEADYPNDNALQVLLRARQLAPSVEHVSLQVGAALLTRERREEAAFVLAPLANNPHGGPYQERARALMEGAKPQESEVKGQEKADAAPAA